MAGFRRLAGMVEHTWVLVAGQAWERVGVGQLQSSGQVVPQFQSVLGVHRGPSRTQICEASVPAGGHGAQQLRQAVKREAV